MLVLLCVIVETPDLLDIGNDTTVSFDEEHFDVTAASGSTQHKDQATTVSQAPASELSSSLILVEHNHDVITLSSDDEHPTTADQTSFLKNVLLTPRTRSRIKEVVVVLRKMPQYVDKTELTTLELDEQQKEEVSFLKQKRIKLQDKIFVRTDNEEACNWIRTKSAATTTTASTATTTTESTGKKLCVVCGLHVYNLSKHDYDVHRPGCDICGKKFVTVAVLNQHIRYKHSNLEY